MRLHRRQAIATQHYLPNGMQADPPRWQASYPVHARVAMSAEIEDIIDATAFLQVICRA
jgi:hypothetical protein